MQQTLQSSVHMLKAKVCKHMSEECPPDLTNCYIIFFWSGLDQAGGLEEF